MEIGAEYLVHSIPAEKGDYFAKEYLVVEVAIFPVTKNSLKISSGHFTLGINRKSTLSAQSAGTVAAALKYPDWEQRPQMTAPGRPGDLWRSAGRKISRRSNSAAPNAHSASA